MQGAPKQHTVEGRGQHCVSILSYRTEGMAGEDGGSRGPLAKGSTYCYG